MPCRFSHASGDVRTSVRSFTVVVDFIESILLRIRHTHTPCELQSQIIVMPRQQQVDEALKRAFAGTDASGKVRASLVSGGRELEMYHYQHLLMRYDLDSMRPTYTWHEKPTDTRILDAALEALASGSFQRSHMKPENNSRGTKRGAGSVPDSREPVVSEEEKSLGGHFECVKVATGREVEDQGSRFIAMVAFPITSKPHAEIALSMLRAHASLMGADHRISAYRAEDGCENFDDDGEDRGGSTLRAALRKQKVIGCVGVVARWYGGRNIGKARFHHIQERIILLLSGLGHEPGSKRKSLRECVWSRAGIGKVLGGICRGNAAQNKQRSTSTIFPRASDSARSCADGTKVARYEQGAHLDVRHVRAEVMAAAAERRSGRLHADEPHRVCVPGYHVEKPFTQLQQSFYVFAQVGFV